MRSPLLVITDRAQAEGAGHRLDEVVSQVLDGGARLVLLRDRDLPRVERAALAKRLAAAAGAVGGQLIIAGDAGLAREVGAAGVHLSSTDPLPEWRGAGVAEPGRGGGRRLLAGRSCHTMEDLQAACAAGLDYATLSPVWPTASKPGYGPALGLDGLAAACAAVPGLPVYALGGVSPGRVAACIAAGAAGVAVMGAIMRAGDPAETVRSLLEEVP